MRPTNLSYFLRDHGEILFDLGLRDAGRSICSQNTETAATELKSSGSGRSMHDIGRMGHEVGLRLVTTREIRLRVASGFRELFGNLGARSAVQRIGTKNS